MKFDYAYIRVVDEQQWVSECLWEQGDQGWELVSAYPSDGCVNLYFKRPILMVVGHPEVNIDELLSNKGAR